jgi:hypothetical protein
MVEARIYDHRDIMPRIKAVFFFAPALSNKTTGTVPFYCVWIRPDWHQYDPVEIKGIP